MSIQFNDTTNRKGLVQLFEREVLLTSGTVSSNTTKLKDFTADVNLALDDFWRIAIPASGKWQLDDSNQTDFPTISTNLVSSQRDYTFTTDESGNIILDIYRVFILPSATDTIYREILPVDKQSDENTEPFWDGQDTTGVPTTYDKTGNGILLDYPPSYNATNGLKIEINREASYFATTDTTKKPGVPGILHSWFYKKPALEYAKRNSLSNVNRLENDVLLLRKEIEDYFSRRSKDERAVLSNEQINYE